MFAALENNHAVGTCQLVPAKKPNQKHRADLAKLLVHSHHRNKGIGASLLAAVDQKAYFAGLNL